MKNNTAKTENRALRKIEFHEEYGVSKTPFYSPKEIASRYLKRKP